MAPQRTRTTISFEQRPTAGVGDNTLPRLTLFEHVAGARVLADLFPYYRLPNGRKAYYYYDAGQRPLTTPQSPLSPAAYLLCLYLLPPQTLPFTLPVIPQLLLAS